MTRVVCHEFCKSLTKLVDDCRTGKEIWYCRLALMDEFIQSYEDKSSANGDFSDVSLMFYLFWNRRRNISREEYSRGLTGYKGVLYEMISEVPTMGTDRLTRKLSVDVNKLIPRYVEDKETRAEMIAVAKRTALEYGVVIRAPEFAFENLRRLSDYNSESLLQEASTGYDLEVNYDTTSPERDVAPPPSYEEAMSICLQRQ
ncbi:hypothetical protein UCDDA912_g08143 [Diaporthe ampelina]|uniref:Uncharacterized protein n=1 Tax=Diaporthe ampelina TaxID=1214573 RepID=A0A0G2FCG7_9PEZI|nr:hypothetical protein UCDDA912_g08143 [Diaporthe ampelina]